MTRLFYGNFDFEHRLAEPRREPTKLLKRLNAELATSWLTLAQDGDLIWTHVPIDVDFFLATAAAGFPRVLPVSSWDELPRDLEFVPWGWSGEVRLLAERLGWQAHAPSLQAVLAANSRATSHRLEQQWDVGLEGARRIENLDDLDTVFHPQGHPDRQWVIKSEFGMSGRERIRGRGLPTSTDLQWLRRRLGPNQAVFYEPWVERIAEAGIQFHVPQVGPPQLIGLTFMFVDERGQYAGSQVSHDPVPSAREIHRWQDAIDVTTRAATHLQSLGYFGPLGIDSMQYRDRDGSLRIRPLQDINARWTMGRLSLGLAKLLLPTEVGIWAHGSKHALDEIQLEHRGFKASRSIATSPQQVGGEPCFHNSRLLIGERPETSTGVGGQLS